MWAISNDVAFPFIRTLIGNLLAGQRGAGGGANAAIHAES